MSYAEKTKLSKKPKEKDKNGVPPKPPSTSKQSSFSKAIKSIPFFRNKAPKYGK